MNIRTAIFLILLLPAVPPSAANENTWVILNNVYKGSVSLNFAAGTPCLSHPLMEEWGVVATLLNRLEWDADGCLMPKSARQNNLRYWYRADAQLLTLLFPPEAINPQQNGVSTSRWDNGINAMFVNYRLDVDKQRARSEWETSGTDTMLTLDSGINLGAWRLRQQNTFWRERQGQQGSYSNSIALWRGITRIRSRLSVGDGYTSPNMFEGMSYSGLSLASDEAMFPDSWRPYSPWINGYARSEAEVTIHQNGERVYRIHVPPGAFTIRDFYPPDPQGNLELTVQESDGTERTRILPYSIMPNLVQHRMFSYELALGRYKPAHGIDMDRDRFWQASLSWGIASHLTVFSGLQQGDRYASQVLGVGGNLGQWGALSADVKTSRYSQRRTSYRGSVMRLRYAKAFFSTETSLNALLQWYPSGSQYRSFEEKIDQAAMLKYDWDNELTKRALQGEVEINHNIDEDSSLSLSWRWTKARRSGPDSQGVIASLNANWRDMDISLYGGYDRRRDSPAETTMGINISIPFTVGQFNSNVAWVSDLASREKNSHGIDVYGTALSDFSLRYDAKAQHVVHGDDELTASLGYQYNAGEANISMDRGGGRRDYHADTSGSVLLHAGGVTFGQTLGSTVALVEVPGTPGIGVYNQFSSTTDANGNLLVSYLTPWRVNRISVDSLSLPENTGMDVDELESVPTEGAIVELTFPQPLPVEKVAE